MPSLKAFSLKVMGSSAVCRLMPARADSWLETLHFLEYGCYLRIDQLLFATGSGRSAAW